jgi:hypothetical protein
MTPMKTLIARLFADSKEINNPLVVELRKEQPANNTFLECQLVLKSGYAAAGVLTVTSEDMLRLASIAQTADKKVVMVDQYFAYEDVETISLGRELALASVTPIRNGSGSIILGH